MKIIESQSAVLTNYEVFQHLADQRERYQKAKRRGPPNLENVVKELLQYLRTSPGPLSQKPLTYTPDCIATLLERLRPYDLSKGEVVMVLNLRPASVAALNTVIEDMAERFTDDQQAEIVNIVAQVLGQFEPPEQDEDDQDDAEGGGEADVSMGDAAGS